MKVALCYSGMIRNFEDNVENHIKHLISKYNCDVYLNFWDVYGYGDVSKKYDFNSDDLIPENIKNTIVDKLKPIDFIFENYLSIESFFNEKDKKYQHVNSQPYVKNVLGMFYKIYQCNEMVVSQNKQYDVVLKLRGDLFFLNDAVLELPNENTLYTNLLGSWGEAIPEVFMYGTTNVMTVVSNIYNTIEDMWEHISTTNAPEHILYKQITQNNIKVDMKPFNFYKIKRKNGNLDSI